MANRSFSVDSQTETFTTPNLGPVECPFVMIPVEVWDGARFGSRYNFLWDTGASCCIVSRSFAAAHRFRLHDADDRLDRPLAGIGGDTPALMTTRSVRFPLLSGRPDLRFRFHFLVIDRPVQFPILGIRDVLANFSVESSWEETVFRLRPDHDGTPV